MDYLCHKWSRICFVCRNHNPIFSSFTTYQRVCKNSNTMCVTCRAGTATLPEHPCSPWFLVLGFLDSIFSIIVCPFILFHFAMVLSVLRFTASNYHFYILKLVFIFSVLVLFHSVYSIIWHSELVIYDINYPSLSVCICFDSPRNLFIFVSFNVLLSIVSSLVRFLPFAMVVSARFRFTASD
jgi:hypothetical protein